MIAIRHVGALRPSEVPASVLRQLNAGRAEAANLMEQIALDQENLLARVLPGAIGSTHSISSPMLTERMKAGGEAVLQVWGSSRLDLAMNHPSDTVRGWGAMAVGLIPELSIIERLCISRAFAADSHFSVREWAWIGVRSQIDEELDAALDELGRWAHDPDPFIRRFASESTRPRGVWCKHIPRLKLDPGMADEMLKSLRSDDHRYVQLSVGNWINDASKSRPDWARATTDRWLAEDGSIECQFICNRGLRTLRKQIQPGIVTR